jgi:LacI family transcriptional regulator
MIVCLFRTLLARLFMSTRRPFVALLIDTSVTWSRELLRGIHIYSVEHGGWSFHLEPRGQYDRIRLPSNWSGDGVIARASTHKRANELMQMNVPVVNVSTADPSDGEIPQCTSDEREAGRLAADHLASRGFESFAYCGPPEKRDGFDDLMLQSFQEELARIGKVAECYNPQRSSKTLSLDQSVSRELTDWLRRLPKPIGVLAWNAVQGRSVTEACRLAEIRVPEQVAVICGEHDDLVCGLSTPPLSSIYHDGRKVGYEAASLLDRLMRGEGPPAEPIRIPASRLIARQSTDILAIEDTVLAEALVLIREQACRGIRVDDVVRVLPISRRALEQKFQELLGRSPAEEIRRVRLLHAKTLLEQTDLTVARIAKVSGFGTPAVLLRNFETQFGVKPSTYRRQRSHGVAHQLHSPTKEA